jgi:hypothetical protein
MISVLYIVRYRVSHLEEFYEGALSLSADQPPEVGDRVNIFVDKVPMSARIESITFAEAHYRVQRASITASIGTDIAAVER